MTIQFTNDVDALMSGTAATFGAFEEEAFDAGTIVGVQNVEEDGDMAKVTFADGRHAMLCQEDFVTVA